MKNWFPFTDYDFYGYLASGFVALFALDFVFNTGAIAFRDEWTFVQVVLVIALAYAVGQVLAWPSSMLLEHVLARRRLRSPFEIQVGAEKPRWIEELINKAVTGRDYAPLAEATQGAMIQRAAALSGQPRERFDANRGDLFGPAYEFSKQVPETRQRLDHFRNLYGLTRNLAFVALLAAGLLAWRAYVLEGGWLGTWGLAFSAVALGLAMFARFLKFYAAFAGELTRCFAYHPLGNDNED